MNTSETRLCRAERVPTALSASPRTLPPVAEQGPLPLSREIEQVL
jgi:hypothetical protein